MRPRLLWVLVGAMMLLQPAIAQSQTPPLPPPIIAPPSSKAAPKAETSSTPALQAARELVALVSDQIVQDSVSRLTAQSWPAMQATLISQYPKLDVETLTQLRRSFEQDMVRNYKEVMADAPEIYAKHFTVQEMRELAAFYRTPLGQKSLRATPDVMAAITAKAMPRQRGLQERVSLSFLNILKARGFFAQ